MDAFYASVELRRRPELKGKPVVVCGSGPRAVVTTASYEARKLAGIHSAMPAAVARRRLPDAVYIQPDFDAYREASGQVMAILRRNAETVEVVGLDEAYVDLTGLFSPKSTMRRIAAEIREETDLGCSIGISENRMLAKIISELGKPGGLVVLSRTEALARFAEDSPGLVPGIGPKTVAKLETDGHPARWPSCDPTTRPRWSRRSGRGWAAGCRPARASRTRRRSRSPARRSRSRPRRPSTSTSPTTPSLPPTSPRSPRSCADVCARAASTGRTIGIKVRLDDWTNVTRSHTVEEPTNDPAVVTARRAGFASRVRATPTGAAARRADRRLRARLGAGGADPSRSGRPRRTSFGSASLDEAPSAVNLPRSSAKIAP